jgi:hypothetical protein
MLEKQTKGTTIHIGFLQTFRDQKYSPRGGVIRNGTKIRDGCKTQFDN